MITGISLIEGPYDGIPLNVKAPVPFLISINGHIYFRVDEEEPDKYQHIVAVDVSDRLPTEEELLPPTAAGRE